MGERADTLVLRPTGPDDLDQVVVMEAHPESAPWLGDIGRGWHERSLADPAQEHLVAETAAEPGVLLGFVVLAGLTDPVLGIRRLVVSPEHHGQGWGRAMLRAAVTRAHRRHGARKVWLDVKPANVRARALYESEGFRAEQELADTPGQGAGDTRLIIMGRTVGDDPDGLRDRRP